MRWLVSWILFWAGDLVSRPFAYIPDKWERVGTVAYLVYSGLMRASVKAQGNGKGPWGPI